MIIGCPKEIKDNEYRVGLVPALAKALVDHGHEVIVQTEAGEGSGISNGEYLQAGAKIVPSAKEVWQNAEMIIKVKEPLPPEYDLLQEDQIIFTYLHLAPLLKLTTVLMEKKVIGIAYETIVDKNGNLPLLIPMSEIAGRLSIQVGASFLEKPKGGRGVLLGGVPGVPPADVIIIGGGVVGINAARVAYGMGARVTVIDIQPEKLRYIDDLFHGGVTTLMSNPVNIQSAVERADLLVGAVLIAGAHAPKLVSRQMVKCMKPGSVIVDVAIDQGGCVETIRETSHSDPIYVEENVIHYAVPNMPGMTPRTSTFALTNATFTYALKIANLGFKRAIKEVYGLAEGVNVYKGCVTCKAVADSLNLPYVPLNKLI